MASVRAAIQSYIARLFGLYLTSRRPIGDREDFNPPAVAIPVTLTPYLEKIGYRKVQQAGPLPPFLAMLTGGGGGGRHLTVFKGKQSFGSHNRLHAVYVEHTELSLHSGNCSYFLTQQSLKTVFIQ